MLKTAFLLLALPLLGFSSGIYQVKLDQADGKTISLNKFKGSPLLIVNIATKCGLTGQLDGLEKLYKKYKGQGLEIVGVPSNEFAGQTPEGDKEVAKFCRLKYGTSFPISKKKTILGENKIDLYKHLVSQTQDKEIKWNFTKFLIDSNGNVVKRFEPKVSPLDKSITEAIEKALR